MRNIEFLLYLIQNAAQIFYNRSRDEENKIKQSNYHDIMDKTFGFFVKDSKIVVMRSSGDECSEWMSSTRAR